MATKTIEIELLTKMFLAGAANLESKKEMINELNVFPVPDGDTGTNMTLTIMSAAKELNALEEKDMRSICKAISSGSLRGARGNSGVILSQLLRGFTKEIRDESLLDVSILAAACDRASTTAYKAVMKPKEGTVLTVSRRIADRAKELAEETDDLEVFIPEVINTAKEALEETPDQLPVLKEAGVVDSGGQGLVEILNGAYDAFLGKEVDYSAIVTDEEEAEPQPEDACEEKASYGYSAAFVLLVGSSFGSAEEKAFEESLCTLGDDISCERNENGLKVHLLTDDPGLTISQALTFGQLAQIRIDNLKEQESKDDNLSSAEQPEQGAPVTPDVSTEPKKEVGFIAVSVGEGMNTIFKELGVDVIIEGGQTMNPSAEDLLTAIDQVNASNIFILPNNKNIILTANQAQSLTKDKNIIVIPTNTIPQGITAIISFVPDVDLQENIQTMTEEIMNVHTGQVTYAIRDTHVDDREIREGDIMGLGDHGLLSVGQTVEETTNEMVAAMVDEESELISLYYGEEVSEEDAGKLVNKLQERYPDMDVNAYSGGQPIYYYIVSVE